MVGLKLYSNYRLRSVRLDECTDDVHHTFEHAFRTNLSSGCLSECQMVNDDVIVSLLCAVLNVCALLNQYIVQFVQGR